MLYIFIKNVNSLRIIFYEIAKHSSLSHPFNACLMMKSFIEKCPQCRVEHLCPFKQTKKLYESCSNICQHLNV